jgi:hypothetical protein
MPILAADLSHSGLLASGTVRVAASVRSLDELKRLGRRFLGLTIARIEALAAGSELKEVNYDEDN